MSKRQETAEAASPAQEVQTPMPETTETSAPPAFVVQGFRSARFGMDAAAVRAAIHADFGLAEEAITLGENTIERTQIMTVMVPNLINHGGIAQVSYVFGYLSKKLIQIGASWSVQTDPQMTVTMLYENGELLRNHFMSEPYASDSLKTNVVVSNGIMMFRGADCENHVTLLLLQGSFATAANGSNTLTPTSLDLLYSSSPNAPDIFRLPKGSF